MLRRGRLTLFQFGTGNAALALLLHIRQNSRFFLLAQQLAQHFSLHCFPSLGQHHLALCGELLPGADGGECGFRIAVRLTYGTEQPCGNQPQDIPLPGREGGKICVCHAFRRQQRMVVGDFAAIDDLVYDRKDLPQIKAIASWIDTHCAEGEISYMIPHDMLYCPDHFKNCLLPQTPINNKLAFGFSVPGTHYFPMQFFEAKYVLTADPFPLTHVNDPENEMSHKLNDMFLAVRDEYFALEETFDMGNGTTFTIWRRTVAPSRAEVEYYLSAFTEEDAKYPEMFSQVAENWLAARGL